MTTGTDIVKGALQRINSYQSGDNLGEPDLQDGIDVLNDLLDSWSTDKLYIYGSNEFILQWQNGQNQYKVGNPLNTDLGLPSFTGTLTGGSNVITSVSNIPAGLVAGSSFNNYGAGSLIIDSASQIPPNAYVTAIGTNTITLSANVPATPSANPVQLNYSLPGDFPIPRPLRITGGYTRVNQLDFTLDVYASQDQYNALLYKAQPGPWPTLAWYNQQFPYGIFNVYQTPGQSVELHLFTDTILARLTAQSTVILPQGYNRALKWLLARELAPIYGYNFTPQQSKIANEAMSMIKALNAQPQPRAFYDTELIRNNRRDGGWVMSGGYK
jgi:hypothetical protein